MKQPILAASAFLLFCLAVAIIALLPAPAAAHLEKGYMPDGVAEVEYLILLDFEPNNTEVRNRLGMVYLRTKKLKQAAAQFTEVLGRIPDDFDALDGMGLVLAAENKFDLAIAHFNKAIPRRPADALVYFHLGQAWEGAGKPDEAAAAYQQALQRLGQDASSQQQEQHSAITTALSRVRQQRK